MLFIAIKSYLLYLGIKLDMLIISILYNKKIIKKDIK